MPKLNPFTSPVTSIIGILVLVCQAIPLVWPEGAAFCDKITTDLIGVGLIKASEGPILKA